MAQLNVLRAAERAKALAAEVGRRKALKFHSYFPDCLPTCGYSQKLDQHLNPDGTQRFCRVLYVKHGAFMHAGQQHMERCFLAANQVGKTDTAAFEVTAHMSGTYPHWWTGRRFKRATEWWLAGDTMLSTRNVLQVAMMGKIEGVETGHWTGMLPDYLIDKFTRKSGGVPLCLEKVWIKHVSGELSTLEFLSYDQGRKVFQGTGRDGIWLDEEPPDPPQNAVTGETNDIYSECLLRTITREDAIIIATFTPLRGLTPFVQQYLQTAVMEDTTGELKQADKVIFGEEGTQISDDVPEIGKPKASRYVQGATWDDAPHLTQAKKDALWASIKEYQRDARARGIPALGAGAVYPFSESGIRVPDFPVPAHWRRGFGLDCALSGVTAAVWGAFDADTNTLYITSVYRRSQAETAVHAEALKAKGKWIPGVGDAAGVIEEDRSRHIDKYREMGLDLELPDKAVEPGISDVYDALSSGKLKVFASCPQWFEEFRLYRRDERGRVVKANDHLMDATRYLYRSGRQRMKVRPNEEPKEELFLYDEASKLSLSWMR